MEGEGKGEEKWQGKGVRKRVEGGEEGKGKGREGRVKGRGNSLRQAGGDRRHGPTVSSSKYDKTFS